LVHSQSLNGNKLVMLIKELGFCWGVGHEGEEDRGEANCDNPEDNKDCLQWSVKFWMNASMKQLT
jgi:hypothetical protein